LSIRLIDVFPAGFVIEFELSFLTSVEDLNLSLFVLRLLLTSVCASVLEGTP